MIGYFSGFITGYLVGVIMCMISGTLLFLILKRPDLVRRARDKVGAWLSVLTCPLKDNRGVVEVPRVSVNVLVKYLLRFGIPLAGVIGLIALLKAGTISVVLYKCCLILTAFILAEAIWVIGYKYIFGKIEKEGISEYNRRSIMLFRGMLYAAIILGLTAGL
jgi:hypothetical protein